MPPRSNKHKKKRAGPPSASDPAVAGGGANAELTQLHRDRAKKWGTTPWVAEWFANGVAYCKTEQGQIEFRQWLRHKYDNDEEYEDVLAECNRPPGPLQHFIREPDHGGNMRHWALAASELGVSEQALKMYHTFTAHSNLCEPERVKAPIKRRRGEPAALWNARLHEALIDGSRAGDMDWEEMRRIALSEYDKTRDTLEQWHSDSVTLLQGVFRRSESTIPHPEEIREAQNASNFMQMNLCAAWRSRLHLTQIAHALWYRAATLFEELAKRGLTTSTAIERACKTDAALKWRLLFVQFLAQSYTSLHWSLACQTIVMDTQFKKYVKASRDNNGFLRMQPDRNSLRLFSPGSIESKVAHLFTDVYGHPGAAFDALQTHFAQNPEDKKKFSESAWQVLGDVAVSWKFTSMMLHSAFGKRLFKMADDVASLKGADKALFEQEFIPMDARLLRTIPDSGSPVVMSQGAKLCNSLVGKIIDTWMGVVFIEAMNPRQLMQMAFLLIGMHKMKIGSMTAVTADEETVVFQDPTLITLVNGQWSACDEWQWERAAELDPKTPGGKGLVARTFGLFDPQDPHRPYCRLPGNEDEDYAVDKTVSVPKTSPAPAPPEYVESIPIAGTAESAAKSGHAAAREAEEGAPKEKPKTRGEPSFVDVEVGLQDVTKTVLPETEDQVEEYPAMLPSRFKLGKKNLMVFRQILGYKERTADGGEVTPKAGVVRWEQFEKAMKRIGFEVVQTAGSSVRFDPPAQTARPITFHRPHPDAILHPRLMKWMGTRLNRYYAWTGQTFEYDPTLTDTATT